MSHDLITTGVPAKRAGDPDQLRRATEAIRQLASAVTRGPWVPYPTNLDHEGGWTVSRPYCDSPGDCDPDCGLTVFATGREGCEEDTITKADAYYIAAMHPGVALAVADLLDTVASSDDVPASWQALAVSRAIILGGDQ